MNGTGLTEKKGINKEVDNYQNMQISMTAAVVGQEMRSMWYGYIECWEFRVSCYQQLGHITKTLLG